MSDRLRQLQRQRALLSEHLAWIDVEIARETQAPAAEPGKAPVTEAPVSPQPVAAETSAEADALIKKYAAQERQNPDDLRRGCLYVFASAFVLLFAGVAAVWLLFYR